MEANKIAAEFVLTESTHLMHRRSGLDVFLQIGDLTFWHDDDEARERVMQKLIREWVTSGWGQDARDILAEELLLADPPAPFAVIPGGVA